MLLTFAPRDLSSFASRRHRLKDENEHVRLNTVMVLTHLILNDMVKVKGQISNLAVCLEDPCRRIADLARCVGGGKRGWGEGEEEEEVNSGATTDLGINSGEGKSLTLWESHNLPLPNYNNFSCLYIVLLNSLFFSELSNKGNAIYNVMPDIISHVRSLHGREEVGTQKALKG